MILFQVWQRKKFTISFNKSSSTEELNRGNRKKLQWTRFMIWAMSAKKLYLSFLPTQFESCSDGSNKSTRDGSVQLWMILVEMVNYQRSQPPKSY